MSLNEILKTDDLLQKINIKLKDSGLKKVVEYEFVVDAMKEILNNNLDDSDFEDDYCKIAMDVVDLISKETKNDNKKAITTKRIILLVESFVFDMKVNAIFMKYALNSAVDKQSKGGLILP